MRVISGKHRSRILKEVESNNTRETKDRVKESIFNSINTYLIDSNVLDLFSGSGSLGIEALSRGSKHCVFNDFSKEAYNVTKDNINTLQLQKEATLFQYEYTTLLKTLTTKFDVILLDPPYKLDILDDILEKVHKKNLLTSNGIIVYLYGKEKELKEHKHFEIIKTKSYGITKVSLMKWND